ncbi:hypothetical protein [Pseudomonas serbica]|uniref:hypothetical protein n=1 Tax=Pseudomonas serbica TaxID=2965074 RepID=UPI00237B3634|nr:hypothetical protein [Pseudomonas serbica]
MKVEGIEITEAQISAMLSVMGKRFRASDVREAAIKAGVPDAVEMRATDRLLIRQRQKGLIQPIPDDKPYWTKL